MKKYSYYEKYINKKTKGRYDVTPLFGNAKAFSNLVNDIVSMFKGIKFNKVVGLDALGFILGGAIANKLKLGFIVVRKGGKLPGIKGTILKHSFVDYSKKDKSFEMGKGSIKKVDKVLVVDEWMETGTQIKSAIKLIEKQGGKVVGIGTLCAAKTPKTKSLFDKYNFKSIRIVTKRKEV